MTGSKFQVVRDKSQVTRRELHVAGSHKLDREEFRAVIKSIFPRAHKLQVTSYRLQVTGCKLQATGYRLQATGYRAQATGYRSQATGHRLQAADHRLLRNTFSPSKPGKKKPVTVTAVDSKKEPPTGSIESTVCG